MDAIAARVVPAGAPRVVVIGAQRDPLGPGDGGLLDALARRLRVHPVAAASPFRHGLRARAAAASALTEGDAELVHLLDARFAPLVLSLKRRFGVPVTASLRSETLASRHPLDRWAVHCLPRLDEVFLADPPALALLRRRRDAPPASVLAPAAGELPWPAPSDVARVARALRGVRPGRLIVGVPWPANRNDFRWFRDLVQPALASRPLCLLFGVRRRREAAWLIHTGGRQAEYRVLTGPLRAGTIAAIARAVDAFAVPAPSGDDGPTLASGLALALAASGAPVVCDGSAPLPVFAHEANAFVSGAADDRDFVRTLDTLLGLPAVQRHFLGEEFARYTLARWPWDAAAEVYAARFAALVGRPALPAEWRAA